MMHFLSITSFTCLFLIVMTIIIASLIVNPNLKNKFSYENLFFPKIKTFPNKILKIASYLMEYVYGYSYHRLFQL